MSKKYTRADVARIFGKLSKSEGGAHADYTEADAELTFALDNLADESDREFFLESLAEVKEITGDEIEHTTKIVARIAKSNEIPPADDMPEAIEALTQASKSAKWKKVS